MTVAALKGHSVECTWAVKDNYATQTFPLFMVESNAKEYLLARIAELKIIARGGRSYSRKTQTRAILVLGEVLGWKLEHEGLMAIFLEAAKDVFGKDQIEQFSDALMQKLETSNVQ